MNAPTNPGTPRSFKRLTPGAAAPAPVAPAPTAEQPPADAPQDGAQTEQDNASDMLVAINFDEALAHSSDGLHKGEIYEAKATKGGNGIWIGIRHADGSGASCIFMMYRMLKVNNQPSIDPATGKPRWEKDLMGQKAWAEFCAALGLDVKEVTQGIVDFHQGKTGERSCLIGLTLMWDFVTKGQFVNGKLNPEATNAMIAAEQAAG